MTRLLTHPLDNILGDLVLERSDPGQALETLGSGSKISESCKLTAAEYFRLHGVD